MSCRIFKVSKHINLNNWVKKYRFCIGPHNGRAVVVLSSKGAAVEKGLNINFALKM